MFALRAAARRLSVVAGGSARSSHSLSRPLSRGPPRAVADRVLSFDPAGSVFAEFTPLAQKAGAVNLGQGFPNIELPKFIVDAAKHAVEGDVLLNQYSRSMGHVRLVNALAKQYSPKLNHDLNPMTEVLTTNGATMAIYAAIQALISSGDSVVLIEPFYDSYPASVTLAGGDCSFVPLRYVPDGDSAKGLANTSRGWTLDVAALEAAIKPSTKLLVLNSPLNPTGKIFSRAELDAIAAVVVKHNLYVIADEVYDSLVYADGGPMTSFASLPGMFDRTITVGSVGKTFSVTGWKIGWALGPARLLSAMWLVTQFVNFCTTTPLQEALAEMFERAATNGYFERNISDLMTKRDRLATALDSVGLATIRPQGAYFLLADTSMLPQRLNETRVEGVPRGASESRDYTVCRWLTQRVGVTAIPPSAFYSQPHASLPADLVRFCFCKTDAMIDAAIARLRALPQHIEDANRAA